MSVINSLSGAARIVAKQQTKSTLLAGLVNF